MTIYKLTLSNYAGQDFLPLLHSGNGMVSPNRKNRDIRMCLSGLLCDLQLFRQRLIHKSAKAYATMPIGIMGRKSLALID